MKKKTNYESFGLHYWIGRSVFHLRVEGTGRALCGLNLLGLKCKKKEDDKVCRNCRKGVTILKVRRHRVAVYRGYSALEAHVETRG